MTRQRNRTQLTTHVSPELASEVIQLAASRGVSVSATVEVLLAEALRSDVLAAFLVPDLGLGQQLHAFVVVPTTAIAEISMVVYLLVVGVKTVRPDTVFPSRRERTAYQVIEGNPMS